MLYSDFLLKNIFITVGTVGSCTDLIVQKIEFVNDGEKRGFLLEILNKQCVRGPDGKVYGSGSCSDHGFKLMVYRPLLALRRLLILTCMFV